MKLSIPLAFFKEYILTNPQSPVNEQYRDWCLENWNYMTKTNTPLINVNSSYKTEKGLSKGFYTGILYLKPADHVARKTLCPFAEQAGCKKGCLESSGQLGMSTADKAKIKRTIMMLLQPERFRFEIQSEITKLSAKHGDSLAIRLNGTSDLDWFDIVEQNPHVQFYDYTKVYKYALKAQPIHNYSVTYSGSANGLEMINQTALAIKAGINTVLAFDTKDSKKDTFTAPLALRPTTKDGVFFLADFDDTDLRFKDAPKGVVGKLKIKGGNIKERQSRVNEFGFFYNALTTQLLQGCL